MPENYPSRNCRQTCQIAGAGLLWLVGCFSGCAVLSIPSYRAGSCGAPEWVEPMQASIEEEPCALEAEQYDASSQSVDCDNASYVPVFPTLPTPKFYQRWKAKRDLPPGPEGLRFHPLPTRPMFQPRPTTGDSVGIAMPDVGTSAYGQVPRGQQWSNINPAHSTDSAMIDQAAAAPVPTPATAPRPTPAPEELPVPSDDN